MTRGKERSWLFLEKCLFCSTWNIDFSLDFIWSKSSFFTLKYWFEKSISDIDFSTHQNQYIDPNQYGMFRVICGKTMHIISKYFDSILSLRIFEVHLCNKCATWTSHSVGTTSCWHWGRSGWFHIRARFTVIFRILRCSWLSVPLIASQGFLCLCQGGLLGHDGSIYGIPYNAEKILKTLGIAYCGRLAFQRTIGELPCDCNIVIVSCSGDVESWSY